MGMGWGGIIGSALAMGAAGGMSSVAKDIDEEQKAAIQARRDAALAKLAQETHKVNTQTTAESNLAQVPLLAAATNEAADKYAPNARARAEADQRSKSESQLKLDQEQADARNKLASKAALDKAQSQADVDAFTEGHRTPEQTQKAQLAIEQAKANVAKTKAEANRDNAVGAAATKNAETRSDAPRNVKINKFIVSKDDKLTAVGQALDGRDIVRTEIPGSQEEPEVPSTFGFFGSKAKAAVPTLYKYSFADDGSPLTSAEAGILMGGRVQSTPSEGKIRPADGGLTMPEIGEKRNGFRYKGGPPNDKSSWEPV